MARIDKRALTKLEIIQVACNSFLENGYTGTSVKTICKELEMSPGNVTFYFPTKEHLLTELVLLLCRFQWQRMEQEANEGFSSVMAICLELTAMAAICEKDPIAKDFYLASYTSPLCLEQIRKNDARRAKDVFRNYQPDWTDEQFDEAEILVSGIEYATLMASGDSLPLETRIRGALDHILRIFGVPAELRETKIQKVLRMDFRSIGDRMYRDFKTYVEEANDTALRELLMK